MTQPQYGDDDHGFVPPESRERLARFIAEHVAGGNRPNHALTQQKLAELHDMIETLEPTGRTEQEADELIARYCRPGAARYAAGAAADRTDLQL